MATLFIIMEEIKMDKKNRKEIGKLTHVEEYDVEITINKEEAPVYPINSAMPIYVIDDYDNVFLIHNQELISPSGYLPSLSVLIEGKEIYLWNGISDRIIGQWRDRLITRKKMSASDFLGTYYKFFYNHKYNIHLKKCRKKVPKFWYWYKN